MSKSWEQILGGYATDTLTEEEKRQLFEAALHDQTLFDALADEEALKALLADPNARQRILDSLQASGNPHKATIASARRRSWFRQPSSLAWAGSIAAAGLALIFGWQMNKDWGPIIQQEQQAERSVSDDKKSDNDEVAFRAQPTPLEPKKPSMVLKKKDESPLPSEERPQSVVAPMPEADSGQANSVDSLGHVQEVFKKARRSQLEPDSPSQRMQEQAPQAPDALFDQELGQVETGVEPLAMPEAAEVVQPVAAKLASAPEHLVGQTTKEEPLPPPGALDRFYAGFGARFGGQAGRADTDKASLEKASSEPSRSKSKEEKSVASKGKMAESEIVITRAKGIRYGFIQVTGKKEEELAEGRQITGDWREVRLVIEPNEAGFLYVFAPVGRGNWQQLAGMTVAKQKDTSDAANVKAYQVVDFPLGVITNRFGKLVISSVTVLFSPTPLENVSKWVSGSVNQSELQIEQTNYSVYVVRPGVDSDVPLRVDITLEE